MEGLKRTIIVSMVLVLLIGATSCEKLLNSGNGDPVLITNVKYVGYEYVILEVTAENFESIYNDAKFYVGDEPTVNVNNGGGTYYDVNYNNRFYPIAVNLNPDSTYYGIATLQGIQGSSKQMKSKKADIPCQISEFVIDGDMYAGQFAAFGSHTYLYDGSETMACELAGDFENVSFSLPYGNWKSGVYTTYERGVEFYHEPMSKNVEINLRDNDGEWYIAKMGQPMVVDPDQYGNGFHVRFCDMIFTDEQGNEVTLSANFAGR